MLCAEAIWKNLGRCVPRNRLSQWLVRFKTESTTHGRLPEILELNTSKEHIQFFVSQRDRLIPADVCSILEGLWESLQKEHEASDVFNAKKKLFNDPDYMAIMKDVVFKLDRYKAEDLPRLITILYSMRWNDKQLFKIMEPMVIREMPSMRSTSLLQVADSFVGVGCGSRLLFDQLVWCCFQRAEQFSPQEVALLASTFAKAPHKPKAFLIGFAPQVSRHMSSFSEENIQKVILAYSSWPLEIPADFVEELLRYLTTPGPPGLETPQTGQTPEMPVVNLVQILRFLALWSTRAKAARERGIWPRWKPRMSRVFVRSTRRLRESLEFMSVEEAAQVMWSYCKIRPYGLVPRRLFESLHQKILENVEKLAVPSLASCLLNVARAVSGEISFWDDQVIASRILQVEVPFADRRMLLESETQVVRCIGEMDPRDLTASVKAYSLSHTGSPEIFSLFLQQTTERCRQFAAEELADILWSYATIRLGPSFAREAQIDILDRLGQFSVSGICGIIWAYCVLRHRDPHFFKTLLGVLSPSAVATNKRCALLCPALLEIRTYFPDMDPEGLERYIFYVQEAFKKLQMDSAAPLSARDMLQECLNRSNIDSLQLADMDGYVVDVLVPGHFSKPVAIQYHSAPRTLHYTTGEPLGQTMMKQRYLRARGLCVVNIWDQSWDPMDFEEKVSDLARKLEEAQKQPTGKSFVGS